MSIDRWKCVTKTYQAVLLLVVKIQECRWVWIVCQEKTCRERKKPRMKPWGKLREKEEERKNRGKRLNKVQVKVLIERSLGKREDKCHVLFEASLYLSPLPDTVAPSLCYLSGHNNLLCSRLGTSKGQRP